MSRPIPTHLKPLMFGVFSARTGHSELPSDQRANDARLHMEIGRQHARESWRDEDVSRIAPRRRRQLPPSVQNISARSTAQRERRRRECTTLGVRPVQPFLSEFLSNIHCRLQCIWVHEDNMKIQSPVTSLVL